MDGRTARAVLGVPEHASVQELRAAFRRRARVAHPDAGGTTQAFTALVDAYEHLHGTATSRARTRRRGSQTFVSLADRHGFCAYDSPPSVRRVQTTEPSRPAFADVLDRAMLAQP